MADTKTEKTSLAVPMFDRLDAMLANLDAYIERRAAEIAEPRIAYAEALAAERDATLREERHRWDERLQDLQKEFQRQITVLKRHRDRDQRRAEQAEAAIDCARRTMRCNTRPVPDHPTDYQRGYQDCADHVTRAIDTFTSQREAVHG